MRIIKSIPKSCGKNGEDYWAASDHNYFLLLDGASYLYRNIISEDENSKGNTNAQWFVKRFADLIRRYMDTVVPAKELVKKCIRELKNEYASLIADTESDERLNEPSASMALIKRTGEIFELLVIGNVTVVLKEKNGKISVIFDDSVHNLENQFLTSAGELAKKGGFDFIDALQQEPVRKLLNENRNKRRDGNEAVYRILGLQEEVVDHALYQQIDEHSMSKILVCTDGFAAYYDTYHLANDAHAFMRAAEKRPLSRMLCKMRALEKKDPKCNTFPRLKISDDATAMLLICGADRRENRKETLWTKFNIIYFRIIGKIQSAFMAFGLKKSYIATVLIAFATIVYTLLTLILGPADGQANGTDAANATMSSMDILSRLPLIATIVSTLATLVSTIYEYHSFSRAYLIISNGRIKEKTLNRLKLSSAQADNGYQILNFFNGRANESYIMSDKVNSHLQDASEGSAIEMQLLEHKFKLADEVAKLVPSIMNLNFKKPGITFNGKLLRQVSDLHPGISSVTVQKTAYFDGQCTHEIVYKHFKSFHDIKLAFDGSKLLMDENNVLYDLDYSSCANFIGISTLVFTKDNRIIIGKQAGYSKANRGRYAPSGSGSVNYSDVRYVKKEAANTEVSGVNVRKGNNANDRKEFRDILAYAMRREFCEECNYPFKRAKQKMHTRIIGYARLLERGGKPDYFGISYIDESIFDLNSDIRKSEYGLSSNYDFCYFSDIDQIPDVLRRFCDKHIKEKKISIQLDIILRLLEQMAEENRLTMFINDLKKAVNKPADV